MNKIQELQSEATKAVKVIIATGLLSMALFGSVSGVTVQAASAQGNTTHSTPYTQMYAAADGPPQAVDGATPDTTNGGASSSIDGKLEISAERRFNDMTDHWAVDMVSKAITRGYVDGYPDGSFQPAKSITRAEFIKLVVSANYGNQVDTGGNWYDPYVTAAKAHGYLKDGDFADSDYNKSMTRLELAKVAVRAIGKSAKSDAEWMYIATSNGLVQGTDDAGTLGADQLTNRAQSVVIIERVLEILRGGTLPVSNEAINNAELGTLKTNIFTVAPALFNVPYNSTTKLPKDKFNPNDLIASGVVAGVPYRAELVSLIAVDWNNPSDPNRGLVNIPDGFGFSDGSSLDPSSKYYVLIPKFKVETDNAQYSIVNLNILGIDKSKLSIPMPKRLVRLNADTTGGRKPEDILPYIFVPKQGMIYSKGHEELTLRIEGPNVAGSTPIIKDISVSYPKLK